MPVGYVCKKEPRVANLSVTGYTKRAIKREKIISSGANAEHCPKCNVMV